MKDEVEVSSRTQKPSSESPSNSQRKQKKTSSTGGDGASIEVSRRPRGRPPGSKNKPKPPVVITRDSTTIMRPFILEISTGNDVVDALSVYSRRRNFGVSIISAKGSVANLTFCQPSSTTTTANSTVTFQGRFEILSISGTLFPPSFSGSFSVSVAGPRGQIVGGIIAGPMVAVGTVTVIAAIFEEPEIVRLPREEVPSLSVSASEGDGGGRSEDVEEPKKVRLDYHDVHGRGGIGSLAADKSIYSCHLPSDVIWSTPPPPPPPSTTTTTTSTHHSPY